MARAAARVSGTGTASACRTPNRARRSSSSTCRATSTASATSPSCRSGPTPPRRGAHTWRARIRRVAAARRTALVLTGLVLLSFNLRPAAVSVGPVLEELRDALGMSGPEAGLLTALPVLAFAVFGALAPAFAHAVGLHRAAAVSLLAVVIGLGGRAAAHHETSFLALSAVALAGMATANVLLPSLVKLHFPDRIGPATAVYTTALATGLTSAFLLTVPIADAFGSWRAGLGAWALLAVLAVLPWLGLATHDRHLERDSRAVSFLDVAHTRIGWAMALFFGLQSLQAYSIFGW